MEVVVERLQGHNIKPSVQRIAIMKYLMEHRTHPTVDEIYTALSPTIPTLSKTTVYNTLKTMMPTPLHIHISCASVAEESMTCRVTMQ